MGEPKPSVPSASFGNVTKLKERLSLCQLKDKESMPVGYSAGL